MDTSFRLNDTIIKAPTDFEIERYNLTKSGRLLSGKMVIDIIAKKRKFRFAYEVISGRNFKAITDIIDGNDPFFTLQYTENNEIRTAVVYSGAIKARKFRTGVGEWYWRGVAFDLIEQ